MARVLVVSAEPLGPLLAGPAIRSLELARTISEENEVCLSAPGLTTDPAPGVRAVDAGFGDYDRLGNEIARADIVIAQALPVRLLGRLPQTGTHLIADLYNPTVFEVLEAGSGKGPAARGRQQKLVALGAGSMLAAASRVMCASESQRDMWLGMMASLGRVPLDAYDRDPTFRSFIDVVPFGLPSQAPEAAETDPIREMFPAIGPDDRVLLWGGGVWNWLDPVTAIEAVALVDSRRADGPPVHLVFMGVGRPATTELDAMAATSRMLETLDASLLEGRRVHVNRGWVPYEERAAWLLAADAAISTHHDHLESRLAFRTRILDALWAGLPVLATSGDELGALVASSQIGATVPPNDAAALAAAIERLVDDPVETARIRERIGAIAPDWTWARCAAPLAAWCRDPRGGLKPDRALLRRLTVSQYPGIVAETAHTDGWRSATGRVVTNLRRALGRSR